MKPRTRIILTVLIVVIIGGIFYSYITPTGELGDFSTFSTASEINRTITVAMVKSKGVGRNESGGIISFYAKDKNNVEARITLHEPVPEELVDANVVQLLGHMHRDGFVASQVTVIK